MEAEAVLLETVETVLETVLRGELLPALPSLSLSLSVAARPRRT
jgi:hypothetical protein